MLRKRLRRNKRMLMTVQARERSSFQTCIEQIKANKEDLMKMIQARYEEMVKEVYDKTGKFDADIKNGLSEILGNIKELNEMEENMADMVTHENITQNMDAVRRIKRQEINLQPNATKYTLVRFSENPTPARLLTKLCGTLQYEEKSVQLSTFDVSNDAAPLLLEDSDEADNNNAGETEHNNYTWKSQNRSTLRGFRDFSSLYENQQGNKGTNDTSNYNNASSRRRQMPSAALGRNTDQLQQPIQEYNQQRPPPPQLPQPHVGTAQLAEEQFLKSLRPQPARRPREVSTGDQEEGPPLKRQRVERLDSASAASSAVSPVNWPGE